MSNSKAIIIDNQYTQYESMFKSLKDNGFDVFPNNKEYESFLDHIRILIDPRYRTFDNYQDRCREYINEFIERIEPDIFIIDYILGGSHLCENGIWLANNIVKGSKPVLFVSIEPMNKIKTSKERYNWMHDWAEKGQYQNEIKNGISESYFNSNIVAKSKKLCKEVSEIEDYLPQVLDMIKKLVTRNIGQKDLYKGTLITIQQCIKEIQDDKKYRSSLSCSLTNRTLLILSSAFNNNNDVFDEKDWEIIIEFYECICK